MGIHIGHFSQWTRAQWGYIMNAAHMARHHRFCARQHHRSAALHQGHSRTLEAGWHRSEARDHERRARANEGAVRYMSELRGKDIRPDAFE